MRVPKNYDADFRSEALVLVRRGDRSKKQIAADLGISYWTLRHWYNRDMAKKKPRPNKPDTPKGETMEQRLDRLERENARLIKENERLKLDREILKKAAAFFAKENE